MAKRLILGVLLAVAALFLAACEVEEEAGEPDVSATPVTPTVAPVNPDLERAEQAMEADRAKPRFRGQLGDFVVVQPGAGLHYPCPEPYQPGSDPQQSELYFDLPGAVIDEVGSCQGTIISITASIADKGAGATVGRGYFVGPKLDVPFDAPAERLKLITVAGKPALAELPIPDCIVCPSQVVVVERFPTDGVPGIMVSARTVNDLGKAAALVEEIMAAGE